GSEGRAAADRCLLNIPSAQNYLRTVFDMLDNRFDTGRPQAHLWSAPTEELWFVRSAACLESDEFSLFAQRFHRSLTQAGFGLRFPHLLTQALLEMAENVIRHSGTGGVVGYQVSAGNMNYVVADL